MRRPRLVTALLITTILLTSVTAEADTGRSATSPQDAATAAAVQKKGISAWKFDGVTRAMTHAKVGWFYTWATGRGGIRAPRGAEFVPMIWGPESVSRAELNRAKAQGDILLGFNEPDHPQQSNMTVAQALELWPRLQATGMRLGAPAVASGADVAGGWLDRFMKGAKARHYRVDFIPVHWYGADFNSGRATDQLRDYLKATYQRYKKPIWLTEYALTDFSSGVPRYPTKTQQATFVKKSTAMLQRQSYVKRYAWFTLSTSRGDGTGLYDGARANKIGAAYRAAG
ncbi:glycoside hydrolase family protein [Streptomyces sp. BH-SS-21]|uniref:Glycoside hydrolase family protein n=1 Tax=Streptomyces liliiviolaceus TaxID=2823109 RepID=A0A940XV25_9ACTN|nr:glycoside hydrolase family protein [Streptomyces liliiviolaceus]MBQ0849438.1 glycoside hydrolase family protein [Streptomyces liliiviolaceus]